MKTICCITLLTILLCLPADAQQNTCSGLTEVTSYFVQVSPKLARIFRFRMARARNVPELSQFFGSSGSFLGSYNQLLAIDPNGIAGLDATSRSQLQGVIQLFTNVVMTRMTRQG